MRRVDVVLAATANRASSGHRRVFSDSNIDNEGMVLMPCPFVLTAPTLMGHFYTLKAMPHDWEVRCVWCWRPPQVQRCYVTSIILIIEITLFIYFICDSYNSMYCENVFDLLMYLRRPSLSSCPLNLLKSQLTQLSRLQSRSLDVIV